MRAGSRSAPYNYVTHSILVLPALYRGTSLTRSRPPPGPYSRPMLGLFSKPGNVRSTRDVSQLKKRDAPAGLGNLRFVGDVSSPKNRTREKQWQPPTCRNFCFQNLIRPSLGGGNPSLGHRFVFFVVPLSCTVSKKQLSRSLGPLRRLNRTNSPGCQG